jgi:hypothetical protein
MTRMAGVFSGAEEGATELNVIPKNRRLGPFLPGIPEFHTRQRDDNRQNDANQMGRILRDVIA